MREQTIIEIYSIDVDILMTHNILLKRLTGTLCRPSSFLRGASSVTLKRIDCRRWGIVGHNLSWHPWTFLFFRNQFHADLNCRLNFRLGHPVFRKVIPETTKNALESRRISSAC